MYQAFFGLRENPFSITPDTRFTYLSPQHEEALAHLLYGAYQHGSGGFALLTGEIGCGKTTLCRLLLERLEDDTETIWILNPMLGPEDFLQACLEELGQEPEKQQHYALYQQLNHYLLQQHGNGKRCLLLIDEAQLLSRETLELLRLLTNLETGQQKLLQILLVGQPELATRLQQADAAPLNQRITARYHLQALDESHAMAYLQHRLEQAGAMRPLFSQDALRLIARASGGVPRRLNILADRALLVAYAQEHTMVNKPEAKQAIRECQAETQPDENRRHWPKFLGGVALAVLLWLAYPHLQPLFAPAALPPAQPLAQAMARLGGPDNHATCNYFVRDNFHCLPLMKPPGSLPRQLFPVFMPQQGQAGPVQGWLVYNFQPLQLKPDATMDAASKAALLDQWRGDLLLLWKDPWRMPALIRPGDRHLALMALRSRWQLLPGDQLDEPLVQRLKAFQREQGIPADGILGPLTQFYLYRNHLLEP